jgi:hypothetical protein
VLVCHGCDVGKISMCYCAPPAAAALQHCALAVSCLLWLCPRAATSLCVTVLLLNCDPSRACAPHPDLEKKGVCVHSCTALARLRSCWQGSSACGLASAQLRSGAPSSARCGADTHTNIQYATQDCDSSHPYLRSRAQNCLQYMCAAAIHVSTAHFNRQGLLAKPPNHEDAELPGRVSSPQ